MGNYAVGREIGFGFAKETAYNEAWGSPTLDGIYINPAPDFTPNIERIKEVHAHGYPTLQLGDFAQGVKNWTLRISGILSKEAMGWLFLSLLGKVTTTSIAGGFYEHKFTVGINTPVSLKCLIKSLIKGTTDLEWRLSGAMVRSLEVIWEPNRPIMFNMELIGGNWDKATHGSSITIPVPSANLNPFWFLSDPLDGVIMALDGEGGWNSVTFRFESVLADDIEDSYSLDTESDQRKRLERASSEEAFRVMVTGKRILTNINNVNTFMNGDNFGPISGTIGIISDYQFELSASFGRIVDLKHSPKGAGIIHEEITAEIHEADGASIELKYQDKQTEPATQGT